jgi:AraC-like DNA-binding protein
MQMFFVAGIGLAVFIEFLLLSKKNKSIPDRILTVWMFVVAAQVFLFYLYFTGDIYNVPSLLGFERPLPLLHGVLLYFYVSFLTNCEPKNKNILALHFIPAALMYLSLAQFFMLPAEQKIEVYRHQGAGYETLILIQRIAVFMSGIVYVVWTELRLRKHRAGIEDKFSSLDRVNLRWLQILTYGLGGIWFLAIVFHSDMIVFSGVVVFVFMIAFFGVRQGEIFAHRPNVLENDPLPQEPKEKYQKSGLTEEASSTLHSALIRLMTDEALYKNSELSIDELASKLGVHPNYLSQIINQREQKHFFDFVNGYRIEEFKRLVAAGKSEQFTLLALAYDSGFSSKTSFNRCFKKATGQTPTEYIASLTSSLGATLQNGT